MLRYLQWVAVVGVWAPIIFTTAWLASAAFVVAISPQGSSLEASASMFLAIGLTLIPFFGAHAITVPALLGMGLLAFRKAKSVRIIAVSVLIGLVVGAIVLTPIYFKTFF